MNAISKKLLSWLCVIAMVLSFVPVMNLGSLAVETNATTTVTPGQANLPDGIADEIARGNKVQADAKELIKKIPEAGGAFTGTCPVCGTEVSWTQIKQYQVSSNKTNQTYHVYVNTTVTRSGNVFGIYAENGGTSKNNKMCVLLGDNAIINNTGVRFAMLSGSSTNVMNIMGNGIVTTQIPDANTDYGMFQVGNGTLNLYGGTYILKDPTGEISALRANGGNVNIYADATIGPETLDTTTPTMNVSINSSSSTIRMYGGTIRNGVTKKYAFSGNVTIAGGGGKFYMYGGSIVNGQYLSGTGITSSPASIGGNVLIGGYAEGKTSTSSGQFYMYGGTVSGGKAYNGGNGGGNICVLNGSSKMELYGGTVKDGWSKAEGGNVQIQGGTSHKIGGTVLITNGYAPSGGNIQIETGKKITMSGGFITGGDRTTSGTNATNGGGVYLNGGIFEMTGGEITGCKVSSAGAGGGIYARDYDGKDASVTISGTAVLDGNIAGSNGGNISLNSSAQCTISGGVIKNGHTTGTGGGGGNICANTLSKLIISGGEIYGGYNGADNAANSWGGNIRCYRADMDISGGYIYDGYEKTQTGVNEGWGNIGIYGDYYDANGNDEDGNETLKVCTVNISGGNIGGDIGYGRANITLSGSPKIKFSGLTLADGTTAPKAHYNGFQVSSDAVKNYPIDVSGLQEGAQIQITGSTDIVFTKACDNAADVLGFFTHTNSARCVKVNTDNKLYIAAAEVALAIVSTGASGEEVVSYGSVAEALDAYYEADGFAAGKILRAFNSMTLELDGDIYIDSYGNNNIVVNGTGKLYAIDASNNDYEGNYACISSTWKIADTVTVVNDVTNPVNGYRYIVIENAPNSGEYSSHRIEVQLTHVTLRTDKVGYYYKAAYKMDDYLASRVKAHGVVLSANNMPGADFLAEIDDINRYTEITSALTPDANHSVSNVTSGGLFGVLKDPTDAANKRTAEENFAAAQVYVYANAYMAVDITGSGKASSVQYFAADNDSVGTTVTAGEEYAGIAHSLLGVLQGVNANWANYTAAQQQRVRDTINAWAGWIPAENQADIAALLPNIFQ